MAKTRTYKTIKAAFRDMRFPAKVITVLLVIAAVRVGSSYPLPFVNTEYMRMILSYEGLAFFNAMTGGSMQRMSLFALSVSPYITASIIVQLMSAVIPAAEEMQRDGKSGRDKLKNITRAVAIALSVLQSVAMAAGLGSQGLLKEYTPRIVVLAALVWTIGSVIIIGLAEMIDWMEVGSGMSILLCSNIIATFPNDVLTLKDVFLSGRGAAAQAFGAAAIAGTFLAVVCVCVFLNDTRREVPVTSSRKMHGTVLDSSFPIPLNTCSVMPVIFAGSVMSLPIIITQFTGTAQSGLPMHAIRCLSSSEWFSVENPAYTAGALLYFALTTFFTYFYLDIGFSAEEIADSLKKSGAVIPGVRPGAPTAEYIRRASTKIALAGNTATTLLILLMHFICNVSGTGSLGIAGTSVIIAVSVIMEEKRLLMSLSAAAGIAGTGRSRKRRKSARWNPLQGRFRPRARVKVSAPGLRKKEGKLK